MTAEPTYEELADRLALAEQTLEAIRSGEVDALVVAGDNGPRVFTLDGADAFYRVLIEQMPVGAAAVQPDGSVLYANGAFADMLTGVAPIILFKRKRVLYWQNADQRMDFTARDVAQKDGGGSNGGDRRPDDGPG